MDIDQIRSKCVVTGSGCWVKPSVRNGGYPYFRINGALIRGHRLSLELSKGPIPEGMYACHRCNNKGCMNPDHLYTATHRQNSIDAGRDGLLPGAKTPRGATLVNALRTHCASGHELTDENTYAYPSGKRACRKCRTRWSYEKYKRKAELAKGGE